MMILLFVAFPAFAQTVGGACTTGVTAGPDANANNLKCVGNVWTANVYADSSGNVGIGTTSPTSKLEVNGTVTVATPTASTHATTKAYVDAAVSAAGGGAGSYVAYGTTTCYTGWNVAYTGRTSWGQNADTQTTSLAGPYCSAQSYGTGPVSSASSVIVQGWSAGRFGANAPESCAVCVK